MKVTYILMGLAGFIGLAVAGVAVAANLTSGHHSDFYSPGKHQFYVWCAGGADSTAWESGANAEDASMAARKPRGTASAGLCGRAAWPTDLRGYFAP